MSSAIKFQGYAIHDPKNWTDFKVTEFKPKTMGPKDVEIKLQACGVCSSDVHTITGGWGDFRETTPYVIAGHEAIGTVTAVGPEVTEFKVGDRAGVGAQVCSCFECMPCKTGEENYCPKGVDTYNAAYPNGEVAQGCYSTGIRVHERFTFAIPEGLDTLDAAPMMCGGLTVFAPLVRHGAKPGAKVGIAGIGGLGHYAVQFAKALGCAEVIAFSHQKDKKEDALKMGATEFVYTGDENFGEKYAGTLDLIICTIDAAKGVVLTSFLPMLGINKKMVLCGLPDDDLPAFKAQAFAGNGAMIVGSHIGNKMEANYMLKVAAEHGVKTYKQVIPMKDVGKAVQSVHDNTNRYRYVLEVDL